MPLDLPTIPSGITTLLNLLAPYVVAVVLGIAGRHADLRPWVKKAIALAASVVLTVVVMAGYYVLTGDTVPAWPWLVLLGIVVSQAAYALVARDAGAAAVERRTSRVPSQ